MKNIILILAFVLNSSPGFADPAHSLNDSPYSRESWSRTLETSDFRKFSELLYKSQRASFPSVANEMAVSVAYQPQALSAKEKGASEIPEFRIEAAHYLALAVRSRAIRADVTAIRSLATEYLNKYPNTKMESKALLTLAHLQNSRDVPTLMLIAKSGDPARYRVAIYGLRIMCVPEAQVALDKLNRESTSRQKQHVIVDSKRFLEICE